jgi:hypothetical protein
VRRLAIALPFDGLQPILGAVGAGVDAGLGARMAGKLLQRLGSPEAIFSASLTTLEARQLPLAGGTGDSAAAAGNL